MAQQKTENGLESQSVTNESSYRPYLYGSKLKNNPNGTGILFTDWSIDHQFNYFRYWIGRSDLFCDNAKEINNALKRVILRKEYDLDDVRDDLMIETNEEKNMNESMIIAEEEFEQFGWNEMKKTQFRLICCEVIDILPFYKEWINELKSYERINNWKPSALNRLLIIFKFFKRWMAQNFGDKLTPKNKFHFAVRDFVECLECYNSGKRLEEDVYCLMDDHIKPLNEKFQNEEADEPKEWWESESESQDEDKKGDVEDANENTRNVYEIFEDVLGDFDVAKCPIFERHSRERYDGGFSEHWAVHYALNKKNSNWMGEVRYQQRLDSMHVLLFHTSARYKAIGLGDSEEHRRFKQYSAERIKIIEQMNMYK